MNEPPEAATPQPKERPTQVRAEELSAAAYWTWLDLAVFLSLALPSILGGLTVMNLVYALFPGRVSGRAALLLPAQFIGYGLWFVSLYLLLKLRYGRSFWRSLGWRVPEGGMVRSLLHGPTLAMAIGGLGYLLKTPNIQMPIKDLMTDATSIALVGVFATTLGPVFEELAFRGFLLPLAARSMGPWPAIVATALPFSILHGPQYAWSWRHLMLLTLASVAFGWVRYRSASTAAAACTHAGYNLTFLIAYLVQRDSGV